jgi:hypothetical protein
MTRIAHSLIMVAIISLFAVVIPAQAQIRIAAITSIDGNITCHVGGGSFQYQPDQSLISAQSITGKTAETQAMFDKVFGYSNLRTNIYTVPVTDKKVNVEICPGDRNYIVYNGDWVRALYDETDNLWVVYGVMAHEMGHYALAHDRTALQSDPAIELQADQYAGEVLAKMGASLENAQAAFRSDKMRPFGHTHPPINQRLNAVKVGWSKVRKPSDTVSNTVPNALKDAMWLEHDVTIKGERVYLEFEPNGEVRTRTFSDSSGYVAANESWSFADDTVLIELFDSTINRNNVLVEYRGVIKGDRIEGTYKNFRTGSVTKWHLMKVNSIER